MDVKFVHTIETYGCGFFRESQDSLMDFPLQVDCFFGFGLLSSTCFSVIFNIFFNELRILFDYRCYTCSNEYYLLHFGFGHYLELSVRVS